MSEPTGLSKAEFDEFDAIDALYLPPFNRKTEALRDEMEVLVNDGDHKKTAAFSTLIPYVFREGIRAAVAMGTEKAIEYLRLLDKQGSDKPEDLKSTYPPFAGSPEVFPWERRT